MSRGAAETAATDPVEGAKPTEPGWVSRAVQAVLAPSSLIGEVTRWSALLLGLGLLAILALESYAKSRTAANLADFELVDFLEETVRADIALFCPSGGAPCPETLIQNEYGGLWSLTRTDGVRISSSTFGVSAFATGALDCAQEAARMVEEFQLFTCAPEDGPVRYRIAASGRAADGAPAAIVALEESEWADRVRRSVDDYGAWQALRTGLLGMGAAIALLLTAVLFLMRARLGQHFGRLAEELDAYRLGRAPRLEAPYPDEIAGLVASFNAALEKNDGLVARQRRTVQKMAHDLRHQLVNVDVAARSGEAGAVGPEVDALAKLVERYLTLVDWIGPMEGQAPVDVGETLTAMARAFQRRLRAAPVAIETDAAPGLAARAHPTDLKIILSNLVGNAHAHADGRIRLSAAARDGALALSVEDDGPGVPEAQRAEILNWGARLDRSAPGSGFGLTIVAEQVHELYGGALTLDASPSLGGLRATVTLPGAAATLPAASAAQGGKSP